MRRGRGSGTGLGSSGIVWVTGTAGEPQPASAGGQGSGLCVRRGGSGGLFPEDGGGRHRTPHRVLAPLVIASRPGRSFHFPSVGSEGEGEPKWPGAGTLPSLCLEISLHSFFPIHFPLPLNNSILLRSLICSTHIF